MCPTPLAEIQGGCSLSLNQRINGGFVLQTSWWVSESLKASVEVLWGAGPEEVTAQLGTRH